MVYFDDLYQKFRKEHPEHSDDEIKKAVANVIEEDNIYHLVEKELQSSEKTFESYIESAVRRGRQRDLEKELQSSEKTFESYIESAVRRGRQRETHTGVLCAELEEFLETLSYEDAEKVGKLIAQLRDGSNMNIGAYLSLISYFNAKKKEDDRTKKQDDRTIGKLERWSRCGND